MKSLSTLTFPTVSIEDCFTEQTETFEAPLFERNGTIYCDSESENAYLFSDYYGEFRGNTMWVNPILEEWAVENFGENAYWDWENAGCLVLSL